MSRSYRFFDKYENAMHTFKSATSLICLVLALQSPVTFAAVATSADKVQPLLIGALAPSAKLTNIDGKAVSLKDVLASKPAVLVFYRGGWCPYCNLQLADLRKLVAPLKAKGIGLIAISPDQPQELFKSVAKNELDYQLYSDAKAQAIEGFGIAFKVDQATISKYAGYGIDLEKASGESHHILPVPSVFLLDANGKIQFEYVNPDYSVRLSSAVVLAAVEDLQRRKN
jgi:peroxiredoxin